jgi:hypothetical protein
MSNMREKMPLVTAFVDDLRAAFGDELINDAIKKSLQGQATFHATENGHEIGTPLPDHTDAPYLNAGQLLRLRALDKEREEFNKRQSRNGR